MNSLHVQGNTHINLPAGQVFAFLCHPTVDRAHLTPLECRTAEGGGVYGPGFVARMEIEIAARQLEYSVWCTEFEPPRRLTCQVQGDLHGGSAWRLRPDGEGTRAELILDITLPRWAPAYLRDETIGTRWGEMLVNQWLTNIRAACSQQPNASS